MSHLPPFFLDTAPGVGFAEAAEAAVQIASLPGMPYAEFVFNGCRFKVAKDVTAQELQAQYDKWRFDEK